MLGNSGRGFSWPACFRNSESPPERAGAFIGHSGSNMQEKKTKGQLIDELSQLRYRIGELEASEAELNTLREALSIVYDAIDSTVGGVLIANPEGRIAYVNPSFLRMFEYTDKKEVLGNDVADFFASKEIKSLADVKSMIDLTKGETGEFIVVRSDDTRFYVEVSSSTVTNEKGNVVGAMASFVDVTRRKQTEMEREDLIHQLQAALAKIKTLRGLVPICASCKKVRDDRGFWHQVEVYVRTRPGPNLRFVQEST
jgi:PAS domain S-box-containing protein